MSSRPDSDATTSVDKALSVEQSMKFADDLVRVYEEEKARRKELESTIQRLNTEIEEHRKTEAALRASEERFRAIFETAQECIYLKDRSLVYTSVNPAMERLLGLPAKDIIGRTDRELYGREAARRMAEVDDRVLAGETIEEEHTRPVNDLPITFLETKSPLIGEAGEVVGVLGIARDITERSRLRAADEDSEAVYPSSTMRAALAKARLVADQETVVLLTGESGSGKDYMASYIHHRSRRANGPFFGINCASVAPEIAESELFGHEPGAFTGAKGRKRGLLELAEGGTLFLNEIGELSPALQAKLLTFLDSRVFTRVGGEKSISVDARLIAATNRDLEQAVEAGRFRRDLFFRLNVFSIEIPPLRERHDDIPVLVHQFVEKLRDQIRLGAAPHFREDALELMKAYAWPGNVRELKNIIERALIVTGGGDITAAHLGLRTDSRSWSFAVEFPQSRTLNDVTKDLKRALVQEALNRSGGNKVGAARLLGISRNSFNHYVASLGVEDE